MLSINGVASTCITDTKNKATYERASSVSSYPQYRARTLFVLVHSAGAQRFRCLIASKRDWLCGVPAHEAMLLAPSHPLDESVTTVSLKISIAPTFVWLGCRSEVLITNNNSQR